MKKYIIIFILVFMPFLAYVSYAAEPASGYSKDDLTGIGTTDPNAWLLGNKDSEATTALGDAALVITQNVAPLLLLIGVMVLIVAITLLGVKFMVANPQKKAEAKTQLITVVIGGVLLFGGVGFAIVVVKALYNAFG